jgi:hypothetical protein
VRTKWKSLAEANHRTEKEMGEFSYQGGYRYITYILPTKGWEAVAQSQNQKEMLAVFPTICLGTQKTKRSPKTKTTHAKPANTHTHTHKGRVTFKR